MTTTQTIKIDFDVISRDPKDNSTNYKLTRKTNGSELSATTTYTTLIEGGLETHVFSDIMTIGEKLLTDADIAKSDPNYEKVCENFQTAIITAVTSTHSATNDSFSIELIRNGLNFGFAVAQ